jgi:hypothetical protein
VDFGKGAVLSSSAMMTVPRYTMCHSSTNWPGEVNAENSDTLAGGPGAGTFVFDLTAAQPGSGVDHILDYDRCAKHLLVAARVGVTR